MFIAEQQLVSAAVGLAVLGKRVVASTFAAFFTRAYDQIRMAAVSNATIHLVGSHCGVSIGQDGPSQMGLEDIGDDADRPRQHDPVSLRPESDGRTWSTRWWTCPASPTCARRGKRRPVIYPPGERFPVGGSRLVRHSDRDQVAVIAAGITRA